MPTYNVDKRKKLIHPWSLSLIAIAVVSVLVLLMPKNSFLNNPNLIGKADAVTVAYLQAFLKADMENEGIRLLYIEHLVATGKVDEASIELEKLSKGSFLSAEERVTLNLRISALRQLHAPKNSKLRQNVETALKEAFLLPLETVSIKQWKQLADVMLQADRADLAVEIYLRLVTLDAEHRSNWLRKSAKWLLALGQHELAGTTQLNLAALSEKAEDARAAVEYLLAAKQHHKVMRVMPDFIEQFPDDRYLLKQGMQTALATEKVSIAISWGKAWLIMHPNDSGIMQDLIRLELAAGRPEAAYPWAKKMLVITPDDVELHRQLANISLWSSHHNEAYRQWTWILKHESSQHALLQTMRLANQLRDYPAAQALLLQAKSQYGMTAESLTDLVRLQEKLGQPENSEKTRIAYLKQFPNDKGAWQGLAVLREYLGKTQAAEAAWRQVEKRFGVSETTVIHRARLLVFMDRSLEGLGMIRDYAQLYKPVTAHFWKVYGDLSWRLEYHNDAYKAYTWLWEHKQSGSFETQRLMIVLREQGDIEEVLRISTQAWQRFKDPKILLLAIESAILMGRWSDVERLMAFSTKHTHMFRNNYRYWLLHARWMIHQNKPVAAEYDLFHVLSLLPGNVEARTGLLWSWVKRGQDKSLNHFLKQWKQDALAEPEYWRAYAAAYRSLGQHRVALFWFQKSLKAKPDDMLWMLEYADALADAGQASGAWRLRQHLFRKMWPNSRLSQDYAKKNGMEMLAAQANMKKRLLGLPSAEAWVRPLLKHADDPVVREFAMRWYFGIESQAALWLMRQHAERLHVPVWQGLAVAMQSNDLDQVYRILSKSAGEIDHVSSMLAIRQQGLLDDAWLLAMDEQLGTGHFNATERTSMLRYARNIAAQSPNAAHLVSQFDHFGLLDMSRVHSRVYYSRDNHTLSLTLGKTLLSPKAAFANLAGSNQEYDFQIKSSRHSPRGDSFLYVGGNIRNAGVWDDGSFAQWGGGLHWRPWQGGDLALLLDMGKVGLETAALRLAGKKDQLTLGLHSNITNREYITSHLILNRYQTRYGKALGHGYAVDTTLGHRFVLSNSLAEQQMQIRLSGQFMRNRLSPKLDLFAQRTLPTAKVETLIPRSFAALELNFNLQQDELDNNEAIARTPIYLFDAGVGWQWPTSTLTYNISLGAGLPILGRDSLSLRTYAANSGLGGESAYGIIFAYGGRFGR